MDVAVLMGLFIVIAFIIGGVFMYLAEQQTKQTWEKRLQESVTQNVIWVQNFRTLSDCTEMTLQLTEKRFYNDTFKQQAWNHFRESC